MELGGAVELAFVLRAAACLEAVILAGKIADAFNLCSQRIFAMPMYPEVHVHGSVAQAGALQLPCNPPLALGPEAVTPTALQNNVCEIRKARVPSTSFDPHL